VLVRIPVVVCDPFPLGLRLYYNHGFVLADIPMKLASIASALGARLENGSPDTEITGVAGIEEAGPGQLTFVANPKYAAAARKTNATAVIVAEDFPALATAMLRSKNPYLTFARAIALFHPAPQYAPGVHPTAVIHPSARIGDGAHVGPYVVINEEVEIGKNAVLLAHVVVYRGVKIGDNFLAHAHAVVREHCRIGNNVLLQNGVVIGVKGRIEGNITSSEAVIYGTVVGNIEAQRLELKKGSDVSGDISVIDFVTEQGCQFNGRCTMNNNIREMTGGRSEREEEVSEAASM